MSAWLEHSLGSRGHTWATIALCSIVLRQGQSLHAHSEAEAILEQRLLFVSLCWGKDRLRILTRKQRPYLSNDCSLFHCVEARTDFACSLGSRGHTWATIALCFIVWGKEGLHKTMRNNSTNHSGGIIDSTWGHVPGLHAHSEAEAILEQRLLFVPLCWGKDRLRMFTRKQRPYLSNDCSLFHCVEARTDFACSLGSRGHTSATIALCFIVLRQGQTSHAHSEAEAILEQRLLFVPLCWGKDRLRMLTRKQRPYLSNDCSLFHCVEARTDFACSLGSRGHTWATIALCSIVLRQGQTSHAHSEAEAILEQRLLFVPLCWGKDRLRMLTRKQRPYLSNDCSLFHCVEARTDFACLCWGKDRLRMLTRKQRPYLSNDCSLFHCVEARTDLACSLGSGGHTRATIALCSIVLRQGQTSHAHSEAEAILEQRLLFVPLCWGKDRLCMLTRKQRPYLSNDCSLFHCVEARTDFASSLETEAILEQRLLFVSLCEARMAFTRLWGIIVQIIPGASLTAPEDECLACTLTRKRRPYLSNDCSLFHCVRQGWPSQDYEE